jgi:CheY-like chemotaxis protein
MSETAIMMSYALRPATAPRLPARPYVLVVDDHRPSLSTLREAVELDGHPTVGAESAAEAIRLCDARPPQVVITDLAMPNLDGSGLARWVRARYPSVPLILVTGEPLDDAALGSFGQTFAAIYSKPVDIAALLDRLARMMPAPPNRPWTGSRP